MMKGVMLAANPNARIVDITHEVPPHDIFNGAFTLARAYRYFPAGTVHVAVIDPGVGGRRKNIALRVDGHFFVGPDNGIFTLVLADAEDIEVRTIENYPFTNREISPTFHGRDVFAPCAAHLSAGRPFEQVGHIRLRYRRIAFPKPRVNSDLLQGEVIAIDTFGNLITSISRAVLEKFAGARQVEILFGAERFDRISTSYSDVRHGTPLALFGSAGYLEISVNEGNASIYFMSSTIGVPVSVRRL
jgi:hypothetical protein